MEGQNNSLWGVIRQHFNSLPDKNEERDTIIQITDGISFKGSNLWILIFAILIASLGLNVNSTAVIIGAMLISPLMGPITGMGLSIGINDLQFLKRSFKNYLIMVVIAVITATLYFLITPLKEAQSELLSRTSPTLYDVLIAICGGAAGIIALSTKGKGNVIPGVAIATALMPPLCTAGYGLASANWNYFWSAFYLFFINTVFISLSTFAGVKMLRFNTKQFDNVAQLKKVHRLILIIAVVTMVPAAVMTVDITRESFTNSNVREFVKAELSLKGTQIIAEEVNTSDSIIRLVAVGKSISDSTLTVASRALAQYNLRGYKLKVIQGFQSDSLLLAKKSAENILTSTTSNQQLVEQNAQIHKLEEKLSAYTGYEQLGIQLSKELRSLYPNVTSISLSKVMEVPTDTSATKRYVVAIVGSKTNFSTADRERLSRWLKSRTESDSLRLITTR